MSGWPTLYPASVMHLNYNNTVSIWLYKPDSGLNSLWFIFSKSQFLIKIFENSIQGDFFAVDLGYPIYFPKKSVLNSQPAQISFWTVRVLSMIHFSKSWHSAFFKNVIFGGFFRKWKIDKAKLYLVWRFFSRKWFGQNSNFRCLIRMLINQTWLIIG